MIELWPNKHVIVSLSLRQRKHGDAVGGPYVGVHLRRMDYLYAREGQLPSLKGAAKQVKKILKKYDLKKVFVATDAPAEGTVVGLFNVKVMNLNASFGVN